MAVLCHSLSEGDAPVKHRSKEGVAGLDPGVSTAVVVYNDHCELIELAPDCKSYNRRIRILQNKIDRTMRIHNPQNYNEQGKFIYSKQHERGEAR
jgi:hypothetical protein